MVTRRDALFLGLASSLLTACGGGSDWSAPSPGIPKDEDVVRTAIPSDDWPTATPESQLITSATVNAMMAAAEKLPALRSMLVIRNGKLVAERYFNNALASDLQHVRSVTKTVSSLLVGQAIHDGKISSASATLGELLPTDLAKVPNSVAGNISLRKVLQMRSGMKFDESVSSDVMNNAHSLALMALGLPNLNKNVWNYDSAMSHLPSPIVARAYGETTALALATRILFKPLGIQQVSWDSDPSGANYGSFGLKMRSRDMAKLGLMALDGGQWQGRSLMTREYLIDSMSNHADLGNDGMLTEIGYGYLWWTGMLVGHRIWTAWGHGGQYILLVPAMNMVIVSTSNWRVVHGPAEVNARAAMSAIAVLMATLTS